MQTLLLSCRKAAELTEHRSFEPLSTARSVQLWMHTRICAGCKAYQRQSAMIDDLLEQRGTGLLPPETGLLEQRIITAVHNANKTT